MKPRILLIVELTAHQGQDDSLLTELVAMEAASRAEDGCLEYTMLRSLSSPRRFVVYEIWQSLEHLERHRQTSHYLAFGPAIGPRLERPPERLEVELPA